MVAERKIPNPHIDNFIDFLRTPTGKDPFIQQREQQASVIMGQIQDLRAEHIELLERYPELDVSPHDQFDLTPYDDLDRFQMRVPDEIHFESWRIQRDLNLAIANHPARLFTMDQLEQIGFIPPPKVKRPRKRRRPIDIAEKNGEILWLSDLGQIRQLKLKRKAANHPQVHRTPFLAVGPLSFVGDRVRSFISVGAMSDIVGSVLAGVTLSKMHVLWHVPKDGKYADPNVQASFVKEVVEQLKNADDAFLNTYSQDERDRIIDRWISCMVVASEADPYKALKRNEKTTKAGSKSSRPYQHTAGIEVVRTTDALKREYGNGIEIFASQISSPYIAQASEEVGASAVIIGVGSSAVCTTADLAALTPTNAHLAWKLRGKLRIPVLGEGGAVNNPVVSALVGMSGVLGSGSLGGGTFEAPGGMFFFTKDNGETLLKPYGGEASPRSKHLGRKIYPTGEAFFEEGIVDEREFNPFHPSITTKIRMAWQGVIVGAADLGLNGDDPDIIGQIQRLKPSPLNRKTHEGNKAQKTH